MPVLGARGGRDSRCFECDSSRGRDTAGKWRGGESFFFSSLPTPFLLLSLLHSFFSFLSLVPLTSLSSLSSLSPKKKKTISPAAINCELFSRDPANVSALLALLSKGNGSGEVIDVSSDLGIRYHATATLAALAASHAPRLASAVLSSPGGVGLLLDLLSDSHGAVAGEARPLLLRLARAAPEVQKIAAFEGAFERLLAGARSAASVGEVSAAQDFLQLTAALLERNPATQVLFREGGHTAALPALLSVDGEAAAAGENRNRQNPNKRLTPQRAVVICAALDLVMALVWSGDDGGNAAAMTTLGSSASTPTAAAEAARARAANQDALLQYGGIQGLLALCMDNGGVPDDALRVKVRVDCFWRVFSTSRTLKAKLSRARGLSPRQRRRHELLLRTRKFESPVSTSDPHNLILSTY